MTAGLPDWQLVTWSLKQKKGEGNGTQETPRRSNNDDDDDDDDDDL